MPDAESILMGLETGTIVPFLGAAASTWSLEPSDAPWTLKSDSPVPSASELCAWMVDESKMPLVPGANYHWDLALVSQFWASKLPNRNTLNRRLDSVFLRGQPTTELHRFLAGFAKVKLVITTNYDTLMEVAWLEAHSDFDVLIQTSSDLRGYSVRLSGSDTSHPNYSLVRKCGSGTPKDPLGLVEVKRGQALKSNELTLDWGVPVLFKIHGGAHPVQCSGAVLEHYLITEDDYVDFLGNPPILLTSRRPGLSRTAHLSRGRQPSSSDLH